MLTITVQTALYNYRNKIPNEAITNQQEEALGASNWLKVL